jgi:hypothetical protein
MNFTFALAVAALSLSAVSVFVTSPSAAGGNVDIVGLENSAEVRLVRGAGAQSLNRRLLVAERFEKGIRKVLGIERLIRQLRNGFLYFNGVQLFAPPRRNQ